MLEQILSFDNFQFPSTYWASQMVLGVKNSPANAENSETRFHTRVGKIPRRRAWQPPPVFLPGESHGWRSLVGYSTWGHEESDTTEATSHACTQHLLEYLAQRAEGKDENKISELEIQKHC